MTWKVSRWRVAIAAAVLLVLAPIAASRWSLCARLHAPEEVQKSRVAFLLERPNYSPVVRPGHFAWTDDRIEAGPIGRCGVVVLDFQFAACVANLNSFDDLARIALPPDRKPLQVIHVSHVRTRLKGFDRVQWIDPGEVQTVWWQPTVRALGLEQNGVSLVHRFYGDPLQPRGSLDVPSPGCYVGRGDMHTGGLVGCSALVLYNGEYVVFAHVQASEGDDHSDGALATQIVFRRIEPYLKRFGNGWLAYLAPAAEADAVVFREEAARRNIPVVHQSILGQSGHSVWFSTRTGALTVVPENR